MSERERLQEMHLALEGAVDQLGRAHRIAAGQLDQAAPEAARIDEVYGRAVAPRNRLRDSFDRAMVRRDAVPLGERVREAGAALWRGFTFLFKISIAVTLVTYVAAFVAMLVALVFVRSSSDRDDRGGDRDGGGLGSSP